jgi:formylglycine-generating enzyme
MNTARRALLLTIAAAFPIACLDAAEGPKIVANSIGMKLAAVEAGSFTMGAGAANWDEKPEHKVTVSAFMMSVTEVTNAQYERFDATHKKLRGKLGFSKADDEAVVFVSWHEAVAFCTWLSKKESQPYRLPTEAEWEYACRAGTTTPYHTGKTLPKAFHKNVKLCWFPGRGKDKAVALTVGSTPANAWGLHDMHGNVEEWCSDWYGPYTKADPSRPVRMRRLDGACVPLDNSWYDPVGYKDGDFKVTRGGSHSTTLEFLRSANRSGALPDDRSWLIGFRVVKGDTPATTPLAKPARPLNSRNVKQTSPPDRGKGPDMTKPYFKGPVQYVKVPTAKDCPVYNRHNHCPAIVNCPNGDLLAIWYTCRTEPGRELGIVASRLPYGADEWQVASSFWDAPDRNDHASALWVDKKGVLYHFNGLSAAATWGSLATIMRTSTDNGATWSRARLIMPEHSLHHMPIESVFRLADGTILVPCDAVPGGSGGSAVLLSTDNAKTWTDPAEGKTRPSFKAGSKGATIAGIHAGVVQRTDGTLMAFGRGNTIEGRMPMSLSTDGGKTWTYSASPFPPIGGGQRLVVLRLSEGPILFCSFGKNMTIIDASGKQRSVSGLFAALSADEGKTWTIKRPITDDAPVRTVDGGGNTGRFTMSAHSAEPRGYMSVCQTPDRVIHLISSKQHYRFNLAWINTPAPQTKTPRQVARPLGRPVSRNIKPQTLPVKAALSKTFKPRELPSKTKPWRFTGSGVAEKGVASFRPGGGMTVDTGRNQRARWADTSIGGFGRADIKKGFTAEIRVRVIKSVSESRGVDFEAFVNRRRYFITVTKTAVLLHSGRGFAPIAAKLDNHSASHTYRLSVRSDGGAQIYRDGALLGAIAPASGRDTMLDSTGPYLQFGDGAGGSETDMAIEHIAYDLSGAYGPATKNR